MCGIVGCLGRDDALDVLLDGLSTLEYRGYDSAGVALGNGRIDVVKRSGELAGLRSALESASSRPVGSVGIGHTRWSTHGRPTDANAHPHTDAAGRVAVVHNGIIENYRTLRDELEADGVAFTSETDTEVVPHLFARALETHAPAAAFRETVRQLDGSYAIAAVVGGDDRLFAARNDSPLVLGVGDGALYLASDVPALLAHTRDVVYLEDGDVAVLAPDGWTVTDVEGVELDREVSRVTWSAEQTGKSGYDHFMSKEINEQPWALRQCLSGRVDELDGRVALPDVEGVGPLDGDRPVYLLACGTSYHAATYAAILLRERGISATAYLGSEYATSPAPVGDGTLAVGVTQSGETADTLAALREARDRGARTLAVTNVVGSTAARECDDALYIRSGPEISVAATKTFSSQLVTLSLLVEALAPRTATRGETTDLVQALRALPGSVQRVLDNSDAEAVVEAYADAEAYFFIGRGLNYPVALEGALKFKEVTYEHAEGFAAGELKHGPLALVTDSTPVFAVVTGDDERARKTVSNVKEVEARDAPTVAVTDGRTDVGRYADHVLTVPETHAQTAAVLATVQLQLVAYHMANRLDRPIDKPRNLAKSVTVE
jgi:glucosamine--fructose-6-phosphate aminotransferase (isomerizing)